MYIRLSFHKPSPSPSPWTEWQDGLVGPTVGSNLNRKMQTKQILFEERSSIRSALSLNTMMRSTEHRTQCVCSCMSKHKRKCCKFIHIWFMHEKCAKTKTSASKQEPIFIRFHSTLSVSFKRVVLMIFVHIQYKTQKKEWRERASESESECPVVLAIVSTDGLWASHCIAIPNKHTLHFAHDK